MRDHGSTLGGEDDVRPAWVRSRLPRPAWLACLLVPLLLTAIAVPWKRGEVERELGRQVRLALELDGVRGSRVTVSGRDATIRPMPEADPERVLEIAQRVPGVRSVQVPHDGRG